MNEYTMGDVARRFDVRKNTVRRWAKEYFYDFMSEGAKPQEGGHHRFNDADLGVFATWVRLQTEGKSVEDAKAFLRSGERDIPPDEPLTKDQQSMVVSQVLIQNQQLKQQVENLEDEIDRLKDELETEQKKSEKESGQKELALQQLESAQKRIEELIVELALLKRQMS